MKISVSTYSFGQYNSMGMLALVDKTAELGLDGIEFVEGSYTGNEKELDAIHARIQERGLVPVCYAVGADFINGSNGDLKAEIKRLQHEVDIAHRLGVGVMRHDVTGGIGGRKYSIGYDDALPRLVEGIREVTKYAEQLGIKTCTENHGFFSQDAARVEKLINTVAHPNFGALVDLGNFMCADEDPWKSVGILSPYAFHVHAKDFFRRAGDRTAPGDGWFQTRSGDYLRGTIIGHGDARISQSIQTLKRKGYDGFVTIEFEGIEDNLLGIEWGLKNLKRFIEA